MRALDERDRRAGGMRIRLAELPSLIPTVRNYTFGSDVGVNDGNFDFAIVGDFDSVDDYVVYRDHPAHQAFITECIAPIRVTRAAVVRRSGEGLVSLALREHASYHGRGQVGQVDQAHHGGLGVAARERLQTRS